MKSHFFRRNRLSLQKALQSQLIVIDAYTALQRTNDSSHMFEQEANFWYLTGVDAPNWRLIIDKDTSYLVAPDVDDIHMIFDGTVSWDQAKQQSGVDKILSYSDGNKLLQELATRHSAVYTLDKDPHAEYYDFALNPAPVALLQYLKKNFSTVEDCRPALTKLRAIKQPEEIESIRRAVKLTVSGFESSKQMLDSREYEYQIEADFTHYFRSRGASGHAYDPIVASGINACTLHYGANNTKLHKGQLVLLDIGARVDGYPADITRTYQIGEVTARHRQVHSAVETAHHEIIALLRPGVSVRGYYEQVDIIMKQKISELGLMKSEQDYRKYFPHAISHGLGIDVHDSLGRPDEFLEGMVLTVEPGIYIPEEGIGVRIEDDILITKTGHENLSAALPTSL